MNIGADFRFEVPGQSSVGLIGGGRGQWLAGGHHGECGARAYNGGLGAEPQRGPGAEPLVRGRSPLKLQAFWSLDVQRSRQILPLYSNLASRAATFTLKNQSTAMKRTGAKRNVCPGSCVSTGAKFPVAPVESAPMLSGNSIRQTVHTHRASVHQASKLVAALLRVARVTAGLAECDDSLPPGL